MKFLNPNTDFNVSPYFDDYSVDKGFVSILYRPGTVQTRELNQMQTIIQEQIARFGRNIFQEGSVVIPGGISFKSAQHYVKLNITTEAYDSVKNLPISSMWIRSASTGLTAKIIKLVGPIGADPVTAYVEYIDGGNTTSEKVFSAPEPLYIVDNTTNVSLVNCAATQVGFGQYASLAEGVYFVRGYYVHAQAQDVVVSKYNTTSTIRVGFAITETIVTEQTDPSLYSNATGEPNYKAPGAHRFKIGLSLVTKSGYDNDANFVELMSVEDGVLRSISKTTEYSLLEDSLAQRTFEESGDYVVTEYGIEMKDHLDTGTNNGVYAASAGGTESKLVAMMKPGVGYVKGYRFENTGVVALPIDKARDTLVGNNAVAAAVYGSYVIATNVHSIPPINGSVIDLYDTAIVGGVVSGNKLGTARIKSVRREDVTSYRIYLFDLKLNAGVSFGSVNGVRYQDASNLFGGKVLGSSLFETNKKTMIFPLPVGGVKTLKPTGVSDTSYTVIREYNVTTDGSGNASLSCAVGEYFAAYNSTDYIVAITGANNAGAIYSNPTITLGGSPVGRNITVALGAPGANKTIKVIAPVVKSTPVEKTKNLIERTQTFSFVAESFKQLDRADIRTIVSMIDNDTSEDVSGLFTVEYGQKPDAIYLGSVKASSNITRNVRVTYKYFDHSSGDFCSVDSYSNINYSDIPTYRDEQGNSYDLRNCLDFRPVQTLSGFAAGDVIRSSDTIRADIEYYLPRIDTIYVDSTKNFGVAKGIASPNPLAPSIPENAMRLYDLRLNPYTYTKNDLKIVKEDNRRYTMRDIGKLEKRIGNMEYYVSLSLLETSANNIQVIDSATGNNRFKNGFAADDFTSDVLSDLNHSEWKANLDLTKGELVPVMKENAFGLTAGSFSNIAAKSNISKTLDYASVELLKQPYATRTINVNPYAVYTWNGVLRLNPVSDYWREVRYVDSSGSTVSSTTYTTADSRYYFTVPTTSRSSSWDTVDTNVSGNTTTTTTTTNTITTTDVLLAEQASRFMRPLTIAYSATGMRPYTKVNAFYDNVNINSYVSNLVTDVYGSVSGSFTVPAQTLKSGTGVMTLTDAGTFDSEDKTTLADAKFVSNGIIETRNSSTSTSSNTVVSVAVREVENNGGRRGSNDRDRDPIAQSFRITKQPGAFIDSIGVAFATKAKTIPVHCQIRTMSNGLPSNSVVAEKTILPASVSTSTDAKTFTYFNFDDPVYLPTGEYAFVLLADTQEYTVFHSRMGEGLVTADGAVSKQPHTGVMFSSSNGSTWTPHQVDDMTFVIKRAKFKPNGSFKLSSKQAEAFYLGNNPLISTQGSNSVTVKCAPHSYKVNDSVTIAGVVSGSVFDSANINGTWTITAVTESGFTITAGGAATSTAVFGGQDVSVKGHWNYAISQTFIPHLSFESAKVTFAENVKQASNRTFVGSTLFSPNTAYVQDRECYVGSAGDYVVDVNMSTDDDYLSPIVDIAGCAVISWLPQVSSSFNDIQMAYVTKIASFDNPSTLARIYIGAKLPGNSNMKVSYQLDGSSAWVAISPSSPIVNDSSVAKEYVYEIANAGSFSGFRLKVEMTSDDRSKFPALTDIRMIALA